MVRYRLYTISPILPLPSKASIPFLNLIVAIIRPLDMPFNSQHGTSRISRYRCCAADPSPLRGKNSNSPVFIITCVVARLTFFLNPVHLVRSGHFVIRIGFVPAQDIVAVWFGGAGEDFGVRLEDGNYRVAVDE
jgi:hypothetical protein